MSNRMLEYRAVIVNIKENWKKLILLLFICVALGVALGVRGYIAQPDNGDVVVQESNNASNDIYMLSQDEFKLFGDQMVQEMYQHKDYYVTSILMHVNAFEMQVGELFYAINMKEETPEALMSIKKAYKTYVLSQECYEYLCEKTGFDLEKRYLDELIRFESDITNDKTLYDKTLYDKTKGINIQIIGEDAEMASSLISALDMYIKEKESVVSADFYEHDVKLVLEQVVEKADSALYTEQRTQRMACTYFYSSGGVEANHNAFRNVTEFDTVKVEVPSRSMFYFIALYATLLVVCAVLFGAIYIIWVTFKDKRIFDYSEYCAEQQINYINRNDYENESLFLFDFKTMLMERQQKEVAILSAHSFEIPTEWKECALGVGCELNGIECIAEDILQLEKIRDAHNMIIVCEMNKSTYDEIDYLVKRIVKEKICGMVVV